MLIGLLGLPLGLIAFFAFRKLWEKHFDKRENDFEKLDLVLVMQKKRKLQIAFLMLFFVISTGVLFLYLWKIHQTSEMALMFNHQVQAEAVKWELWVGGLYAFTFFMTGVTGGALTVVSKMREELVVKFRGQLLDPDESHEKSHTALIESWLRQLGA